MRPEGSLYRRCKVRLYWVYWVGMPRWQKSDPTSPSTGSRVSVALFSRDAGEGRASLGVLEWSWVTAPPWKWGNCCLIAILIRNHYVSFSPSRMSGSLLRELMIWLRFRLKVVSDSSFECAVSIKKRRQQARKTLNYSRRFLKFILLIFLIILNFFFYSFSTCLLLSTNLFFLQLSFSIPD